MTLRRTFTGARSNERVTSVSVLRISEVSPLNQIICTFRGDGRPHAAADAQSYRREERLARFPSNPE